MRFLLYNGRLSVPGKTSEIIDLRCNDIHTCCCSIGVLSRIKAERYFRRTFVLRSCEIQALFDADNWLCMNMNEYFADLS